MHKLFALICVAALNGAVPAYAKGENSDPVVDQFVYFCMGNVQSADDITARPAAVNWSPASFPADYRLDTSETKLASAWNGSIEGKPYELLIASIVKPNTKSLMCILRTTSTEDAGMHHNAFKTAVQTAGLKLESSRAPKIYKYGGKTKTGRLVQARLASTLPVFRDNGNDRVRGTFYVAMSILHEVG